jgi:hypothetical protein
MNPPVAERRCPCPGQSGRGRSERMAAGSRGLAAWRTRLPSRASAKDIGGRLVGAGSSMALPHAASVTGTGSNGRCCLVRRRRRLPPTAQMPLGAHCLVPR